MKGFVARIGVFGAALLLFLEILMRTAVPAADLPLGYQDRDYGIMRLDTSAVRDGRNSVGRLARPTFTWHVNDAGFNSAWEYLGPEERPGPCAVVLGNSYVQGLYSDVEDHLAGQLQRATGGTLACYNLGTSGMPLSQCTPVLQYARDRYRPDLVVILASSLARSLRDSGTVPYCRQFRLKDGVLESLPPTNFTVNRRNRLLRRSALVRYLYYNANLDLGGQGDVVESDPEAVAGDADEMAILRLVVDTVLDELSKLADGAPVIVVSDAQRNLMYAGRGRPERDFQSDLIEASCRERGVLYLDLTETFWQDYASHGQMLNFRENYHWNPYATGLATGAIVAVLQARGILDADGRWAGAGGS